MSQTITRKNYWSLDVAKFFCAILIISSHFASEWGNFPAIIDYAFSLYVIAVPFFFCCSGFLFFRKLASIQSKDDKKKYFVQYEKRIWTMYALWSAVYFIHICSGWIANNEFSIVVLLKYLYKSVVMSSYATIWFLPALSVGIAITYFLVEKLNKRYILPIVIVLYLFGMFGYTYRFAVDDTVIGTIYDVYDKFMFTSRNGIFNGTPFIFMGYMVATKDIKSSLRGFVKYAVLAGISLVMVVIEAFLLKVKFGVSGMDILISLPIFVYFFIMAVMQIELKENKLWIWCRKLSLLMFVSQRLFLTMLPAFFPNVFSTLYANSYVGLVAVILITIVFSIVFILLSDRVKFLKKMI